MATVTGFKRCTVTSCGTVLYEICLLQNANM